jgi:hypothetical protein
MVNSQELTVNHHTNHKYKIINHTKYKKTRLKRANALFVKFTFKSSNHKNKKHEKTRLNRADALFVELTCNDYILISQVNGQAAYTVACIESASP